MVKRDWATGLSSRLAGGKRIEWREWLWADYVISTCLGNEHSQSNPSELGIVRTVIRGPTVYVVEFRGKWVADAESLSEAKELVEAHNELEDG